MRHVVLGATGQLGSALVTLLGGEVVALSRSQADFASPGLAAAVRALRPDVVINCAAYNLVDRAESEPEAAFRVNAWAVRELAALCGETGAVFVHVSTNYVFGLDAARRTPYRESDAPGPLSAYGVGKLAGEYFARSLCPRHFVVRTSALFGLRGRERASGNFIETMLRRAQTGQPVRVVNDQVCTPTSAEDLAHAMVRLLDAGGYGVYHLTGEGECSWFEYAQTIFREAGQKVAVQAVSSAEFAAPARRPAYSVLGTEHDRAALGIAMRPWQEAVRDYLRQRT